jgi:glycosyltransferase involved in cell wall biosynthesis
MWFFSFEGPPPYVGSVHPPDLNFIGRTEKQKGPHVFLQLLWWLPASSYHAANVIGQEHVDERGVSSTEHLRRIAAYRQLRVHYLPCMTPPDLARQFASKAMTVLPSLSDTLNLVALESLLSGCPTAVADRAGVCRYLRDRYPRLPFVTIPMDRYLESVPVLEDALRDYDGRRAELAARLREIDRRPAGPGLESAYTARAEFDAGVRMRFDDYYARLLGCSGSRLAAA